MDITPMVWELFQSNGWSGRTFRRSSALIPSDCAATMAKPPLLDHGWIWRWQSRLKGSNETTRSHKEGLGGLARPIQGLWM